MRRIPSNAGLLVLCLLMAQIAGLPAYAESDAVAPEAADTHGGLEEIVVTARRRQETLQEVPESVTAFTQQTLTDRSITSAFDLSKAVPGLTVDADSGTPALPAFSIRGRGQNYGAAAGSVETYFADVPLSAPFQIPTLPPQFFDLQSLQVLKGPQGTLFGRSTTGGAVVIVPQAPTDEFGGYARLQGGTYGDFQAEAAVNIPLIADKADLRVAGFDWQRDGYMHTYAGSIDAATGKVLPAQTYDNVNIKEFRATLRLRPVAGLENSTIFTFHTDDNRSSAGAGLNILGLGAPNGQGAFFTPGYGTRYSSLDTDLDRAASNVWAVINTTSYNLMDALTVKNIFGYVNASGYTNDPSDSDGTAVLAASINQVALPRPLKNRQTTDELQLSGHEFDDRLTWIFGGLLDQTREPGALNTMNVYTWTENPGGTIPGDTAVTDFEQNTINSYGAFGSASFKITHRLNLSAGFRHSWDDVTLATAQQTGFGTVVGVGGTVTAPLTYYNKSSQGNTYNINLEYHLTDQAMLYGGYRRGYKRGGFNPSQTDPALTSFNPETVDDYPIGLKDDFVIASMPGRFNIEAYYDFYHGMQVSYLGLNYAAALTTVTTNVPATTFRGLDMEFTLAPMPWLTLNANYSLIDAFNTRWPDTTLPGSTINLAVNPVPYASKNKFTITARLHTELPNNAGEFAVAPSVNYQDKFYTGPLGAVIPAGEAAVLGQFNEIAHGGAIVPSYTTVDLRAEWNHVMGSKIDAALNGTNLTSRLYFLGNTGNTLQIGAQGNAYGPPRMVTLDLSTKF